MAVAQETHFLFISESPPPFSQRPQSLLAGVFSRPTQPLLRQVLVHSQFQLAYLPQLQFSYCIDRGEFSLHHEASSHALSTTLHIYGVCGLPSVFRSRGRPYQSRAPNEIPIRYKGSPPSLRNPLARSSDSRQHNTPLYIIKD